MGSGEPHVPGFDEIVEGLGAQDPDDEKRAVVEARITRFCVEAMRGMAENEAADDPDMALLVGVVMMFCQVGFPHSDPNETVRHLFPGDSLHRIYTDMKEARARGW